MRSGGNGGLLYTGMTARFEPERVGDWWKAEPIAIGENVDPTLEPFFSFFGHWLN